PGMLRRRSLIPAALAALAAPALAQTRQAPPHEWLFGVWTGGQYPALDTDSPRCFGTGTIIFTLDVVLRAAALDVAYRQRLIETVALTPDGVEIRLVPVPAQGGRLPPEIGFGCDGNPNLLRVSRRGPDEIVFPNCGEFPLPLRRCRTS
ncbi:MAG: hypothetical protein ACK44F_10600, partial [Roseococcus sp.]